MSIVNEKDLPEQRTILLLKSKLMFNGIPIRKRHVIRNKMMWYIRFITGKMSFGILQN